MVSAWVNLSTKWSLSSVQATLNVVISVLGTIGIWTLSRIWWQRAGAKVVRDKTDVRLPALYTVAAPGDIWDVMATMGRQLWKRESWHLLFQLLFVLGVTLTTMFSGPIATLASRRTRTIQTTTLDVLQAIKAEGSSANLLDAVVLWNATIGSLDDADFPLDQLQDFLPPSSVNWTYKKDEWDPSWTLKCNFTDEVLLHNVTGTGNATFYDPIHAFSGYAETYDSSWLNTSRYRTQADFIGWTAGVGVNAPFTDIIMFIMLMSDPAIDDRWDSNNETMEVSISALHLQNVSALNDQWFNLEDEKTWRPLGPVANASYTRSECLVKRKPQVPDEDLIPWVWTNDTYSITLAYRSMWSFPFAMEERLNITYPTPPAQDLVRFYQAYMVTLGISFDPTPSPMRMSVWMQTVQLSLVFLSFVMLCVVTISVFSIRYFYFLQREKVALDEAFVPDGKLEWMVYAAKASAPAALEDPRKKGQAAKSGVYFNAATFGYSEMNLKFPQESPRRPSLARVYTRGTSTSGLAPRIRESTITPPVSDHSIVVAQGSPEVVEELEIQPETMKSCDLFQAEDIFTEKRPSGSTRDHSPHSGLDTLHPQISRNSSKRQTTEHRSDGEVPPEEVSTLP